MSATSARSMVAKARPSMRDATPGLSIPAKEMLLVYVENLWRRSRRISLGKRSPKIWRKSEGHAKASSKVVTRGRSPGDISSDR
eukprot:6086647-Pyramimonas_sp.AAC.1